MEIITAQSNAGTGRRSASITTQYSSQSVNISEPSDISTQPDANIASTETVSKSTTTKLSIRSIVYLVQDVNSLSDKNSLQYDFLGTQVITHDMKDKVQWWNALKSYPLQVHALFIRPQTENGTPWVDAPQVCCSSSCDNSC